jgi:ATP-binding cassette subfamily B protein
VLGTVLSLSSAIYIQKIVDNVIVDGNRNLLRLLGVSMLLILGARIVLGYFQSILMLKSAQRIDAGLILGYYRHLMRLPQSFFDTMRVGEITSRVRDAVAIRDFLNGTILSLVLNPLILLFAFAAMFAYSWRLAVYSLLLIPVNLAIYLVSDWLNRRYQREIMERSADFDAQLVESLHAISVVRSRGLEDQMSFRSETRLVRLLKRVWSAANAGLVVGSAGTLTTQAYSIGLLWIGASLVLDSQLTAGELMSCNALAGYLTGPIVALIGINTSIRTATTATDRLYEILDLEREKDEGTAELSLKETFDLRIERLNFHHAGRLATLQDVSLECRSGTITALVGQSGCGKSTLLALLQRHYAADSGAILLNGVDLHYLKLASLRAHIGYVPQRIDLLAGTVLENIAPDEAQPDMVRIVDLCRRAGILDFVESLPRGFQTLITENGANLSGGQKQRLAIVRALYPDTPILLMDEPSSALDAGSEEQLMQMLQELRQAGKLIILAAHNQRLREVSDRIVEMRDGRIVSETAGKASTLPAAASATSNIIPLLADEESTAGLVDPNATRETQRLFAALWGRLHDGVLFGHTDANVMGIDASGKGWFMEEGRCDLHAITGRYPAVYGFDVGHLHRGWAQSNGHMVPKIREAFSRDGIATVGWHPENPLSGENFHAGSPVPHLLPGAAGNRALCERLDLIADHLGNLRDSDGRSIPIIFRPWHDSNGGRYWWGDSRCTPDEYIRLYRFTVTYLRDVRRVRNFLYAFSPELGDAFEDGLERYPGHGYVDVIGLDAYGDLSPGYQGRLIEHIRQLVLYAEANAKVPALTALGFKQSERECGLKHCASPAWLTEYILNPIKSDPIAHRVRYLVFWRNEAYNPDTYYLAHPGSPHEDDLIAASADPYVVLGDRLEGLYGRSVEPVAAETQS